MRYPTKDAIDQILERIKQVEEERRKEAEKRIPEIIEQIKRLREGGKTSPS